MAWFSRAKGLAEKLWRHRTLPDDLEALRERVERLELALSRRDPLACAECGHAPVRIEVTPWQDSLGRGMQRVRRACPACGVAPTHNIESRS